MSPEREPGGASGDGADTGDGPPALRRLDPERAVTERTAGSAGAPGARRPAPPAIDPRRSRLTIGIIGLTLVVALSVYQFVAHRNGTIGVPAGQRLHVFAAPLAATDLNGDATLDPTCDPARHDPRALNVCLLTARAPLVLAFFVTGAGDCLRQVDAVQRLSARFPAAAVTFAAVAVAAGHRSVAALVRTHHWTIPVAYDRDGAVQSAYGVIACPMVELAYRGGVVRDRLIGDRWQTAAALGPRVAELVSAQRARG